MMKTCTRCKVEKPITEFRLLHKRYRHSYCNDCFREYHREWTNSPAGQRWQKANNKRFHKRRPNYGADYQRQRRLGMWERIFTTYGRVCVCCGEAEPAFLTVDHVNNDGGADRKKHGNSAAFRWWLSNQPAKLPDYAMMCFNCNLGRERNNGICPHQPKLTLVERGE